MPRVVHVLRKFEPAEWGGIETYLLGLLPELQRLGWSSEVHAPAEAGTDGSPLRECGAEFRTFRARYPYLGMSAQQRAQLVASGGNLVSVHELARLLADRRASVFHVHTQNRLGGVVRLASRLKRVPYAVTLHGPVRSGAGAAASAHAARTRGLVDLGLPFGFLVGARRVVRDADLVFVINREEQAAWSYERSGRHLELLPHGVATGRASPAARSEARRDIAGLGDAPFMVVVARIDPNKGHDLAVQAFRRAAPPHWHLVFAGSVTSEEFAREVEADAQDLGARVHFLGGVPPARARALLAEAALVLVPSRVEPFGIVLLEAWAEGALTLFADVGGLSEIALRAGATLGRVEASTEEAWSNAIRAVLARPEEAEAERLEAPARVAQSYSWATVARRTVAAYQGALKTPGRG